jgi:ketosteroid isomerase-like protein
MKDQNYRLIEKFYSSFQALDAASMVDCYHDNVVFEDPAFGTLKGERAKNMWRMLCESQKGKDFKVDFSNIEPSDKGGSALWEAKYIFSKTGRGVHNRIRASFEITNGKIISHIDDFDLKKWASQALGFKGRVLGGTAFFQKKLQAQTNEILSRFEARR